MKIHYEKKDRGMKRKKELLTRESILKKLRACARDELSKDVATSEIINIKVAYDHEYLGEWCPQFVLYAIGSSHVEKRELPIKKYGDITILGIEAGAKPIGGYFGGLLMSDICADVGQVLVITGAQLQEIDIDDGWKDFKWVIRKPAEVKLYAVVGWAGQQAVQIQKVSYINAIKFLLDTYRTRMKKWNQAKSEISRKIRENTTETVPVCKLTFSDKWCTDIYAASVSPEGSDVFHVSRDAFFCRETDDFYFRVVEHNKRDARIVYLTQEIAALMLSPSD